MLLGTTYAFSYAQKLDIYEITGQVLSEKTGKPVRYANIINVKKSTGVACDSMGYFTITVLSEDLIKVYALGYEKEYISFSDKNINPADIIIIKLKEKTYKISNVNIFEERWKDFVFDFSHTEIEEDEIQENIENWFYSHISARELSEIVAGALPGIPINYLTKSEKQKLKVIELKRIASENKLIKHKYNTDLVTELTGLNQIQAEKFMKYCNFSHDFLVNATEYDIITAVKENFEEYLKKQSR